MARGSQKKSNKKSKKEVQDDSSDSDIMSESSSEEEEGEELHSSSDSESDSPPPKKTTKGKGKKATGSSKKKTPVKKAAASRKKKREEEANEDDDDSDGETTEEDESERRFKRVKNEKLSGAELLEEREKTERRIRKAARRMSKNEKKAAFSKTYDEWPAWRRANWHLSQAASLRARYDGLLKKNFDAKHPLSKAYPKLKILGESHLAQALDMVSTLSQEDEGHLWAINGRNKGVTDFSKLLNKKDETALRLEKTIRDMIATTIVEGSPVKVADIITVPPQEPEAEQPHADDTPAPVAESTPVVEASPARSPAVVETSPARPPAVDTPMPSAV